MIITERGLTESCIGEVLQLKVHAQDFSLCSWRKIWEAFVAAYPGQWAIQVFPPERALVDGKNVYHLWVLKEEPWGLNLS